MMILEKNNIQEKYNLRRYIMVNLDLEWLGYWVKTRRRIEIVNGDVLVNKKRPYIDSIQFQLTNDMKNYWVIVKGLMMIEKLESKFQTMTLKETMEDRLFEGKTLGIWGENLGAW